MLTQRNSAGLSFECFLRQQFTVKASPPGLNAPEYSTGDARSHCWKDRNSDSGLRKTLWDMEVEFSPTL